MTFDLIRILVSSALGIALYAGACVAWAQDLSQSITRSTRPFLARLQPGERGLMKAEEIALSNSVTVGLSYVREDGGDGHTLSLPLSLEHTTANGWVLDAESGFARVSAPDGTHQGVTDLTLVATHQLTTFSRGEVSGQLLGAAALGIPSHGEVGSTAYSQQLRLIGAAGTGPWAGVLAGVLVHLGDTPEGIGSVVKVLHGEVHRDLSSRDKLVAKLERSVLRGAGGTTTATLELDRTFSPQWSATLGVTRGLTTGARSSSVDLTASRAF